MLHTRVPPAPEAMRKAPRQGRSRVMVSAILQAAARVLAENGWAKFTTNAVASLAGVSIGSLYQYFPNKLALAEALRQQHLDCILQVFALADAPSCAADGDALTASVGTLIDGIVAAHLINPQLHRVLLDEVPLSGREAHEGFEQRYAEGYQAFIRRNLGGDSPRTRIAGRVLASAIEGVVHDAARNGELDSPALRRELVLLVRGYLRG